MAHRTDVRTPRGHQDLRPPLLNTRSSCAVCGAPMRRIWTDDLADFRWSAEDGSVVGVAKDVPDGAPESTEELLDLLVTRGEFEAYSSLLALYESGSTLLPWEHRHQAIEPPTLDQLVPECHGWPMRAAPGVWICRADGETVRPPDGVA